MKMRSQLQNRISQAIDGLEVDYGAVEQIMRAHSHEPIEKLTPSKFAEHAVDAFGIWEDQQEQQKMHVYE